MKESNKQRSKRVVKPVPLVIDNPKLRQAPVKQEADATNELIGRVALYLLVAVILASFLACTPVTEVRYVQKEITRPVRPVLPTVKEQELECVSQDTYQRLYDRQRLIGEYAKTLEAIIDSTKPEVEK